MTTDFVFEIHPADRSDLGKGTPLVFAGYVRTPTVRLLSLEVGIKDTWQPIRYLNERREDLKDVLAITQQNDPSSPASGELTLSRLLIRRYTYSFTIAPLSRMVSLQVVTSVTVYSITISLLSPYYPIQRLRPIRPSPFVLLHSNQSNEP